MRYFTGQPCSRGHIDTRLVSTGACRSCAIENSSAYRERNPEKVLEAKRSAYHKNREQNIRSMAEYRVANKAGLRDATKRRYRKNRERYLQISRDYQSANRKSVLATQKVWRDANVAMRTALESKRRSRKRHAIPAWYGEFDEFVWQEAAVLVQVRRDETGINWSADHMIPLQATQASGLHCAENCQVIPWDSNQSKGNKLILTERLEWLK